MDQKNKSSDLSIIEHVIELRRSIIIIITSIIVGSSVAHYFYKDILWLLLRPIGSEKLVFLSPLDPLFFILKLDLMVGVLITFPIISWCIFSYIKPTITDKIQSVIYVVYALSALMVFVGVCYAYLITIPLTFKFLSSIIVPGIESTITAQSYLGFFMTQILIIAFVFQIPLFIILGIYLRLFSTRILSVKRGYIYIGLTIVLAILTPTPDIFSLGIILFPALVIFEVSLIVGRLIEFVRTKKTNMRDVGF